MKEDITWRAFSSYKPRYQKVYGVIAISKKNRILLVKGRERNKWSFPKGHYEGREKELECALRECYEETGISLENINYNHYKKLSSGSYYIYTNMDEVEPTIRDDNEICDVAWVSIHTMMKMNTNIDVSRFLSLYKTYMYN